MPAIYYWEACQWIRANSEFSALWAKKETLSMLPFNMHNEAQLWLHKDVLGPSAFATSATEVRQRARDASLVSVSLCA